jgi:60 kDa SS-A/Ro ribonucleoprotein
MSTAKSYTNIKCVVTSGQMAPRVGHEDIMIKNSSGGFTYKISDEEMINRILILGTNSNTYYSSAEKLTNDAIEFIKKMVLEGNGLFLIEKLKEVYVSGRAPKQDPLFFVLALLTQSDMPLDVRKSGYDIVSNLRTFSQLYLWKGIRKQLANKKKCFGRAVRDAFFRMIQNKSGEQFAYQAVKYRSRKFGSETWSIDDIIKCSHIPSKKLKTDSQLVISYLIKGMEKTEEDYKKCIDDKTTKVMQFLRAVEVVKSEACTSDTAIQLVRQFKLPREVLHTKLLNDSNVWRSLLFTSTVADTGVIRKIIMPITALIRNLGVMSQRGLFDDCDVATLVANYITNPAVLKAGRVHPVTILLAKLTYSSGKGIKGKLTWSVNKQISDALEEAFYVAFGNIEGTGKRIMHAIDCSGSMTLAVCAIPYLSACQAVSTLVMEAVRREYKYHIDHKTEYVQDIMLFNHTSSFVDIDHTHKLNEVMKIVQDRNFGSTDCAQPMIKALEKFNSSEGKYGLYDLFIVYTDNETYYNPKIHPSEALDNYIKATGIDAKMVVIGTTPTPNSIGYGENSVLSTTNPKNNTPLALNIVGFDLNAPILIRNFTVGGIAAEHDEFVTVEVEDVDASDEFVIIDSDE